MSEDDEPQPEVAFMAAALVLLVLPVVVMVGVAMFGLAAGFFASIDNIVAGTGPWLLGGLFIAWVALVVVAVLMLVSRLSRTGLRH